MKHRTIFRVGAGGEELLVVSFDLVPRFPPILTPTEREVVAQVMHGESNASIAEDRSTSAHTVANQISSIFTKLAVNSRAELALRLHRHCRSCETDHCGGCVAIAAEHSAQG